VRKHCVHVIEMTKHRTINCLLCGSGKVIVDASLTGAQVRTLWNGVGNDLSDRALGPITPDSDVVLYRCASCGFRFYDPDLAGSAAFYEELMEGRNYPDSSPEFAFALDFANRHGLKRVLDIGGGEGAFLDQARKYGLETSGAELNRNAAETAARKGHRMFSKPMELITLDELDGGTDMLTLFQVIEHVPSPVDFVTAAARLVRAGGYLVIAVPSERRMLGLLHYDPANWPPHHVSRWLPRDIAALATRAGLEIIKQGSDPLLGRAITWAFNLHNQLASSLGHRGLPGGEWLPRMLSLGYRIMGCKHYLPCHGLSIYAVLRKPFQD